MKSDDSMAKFPLACAEVIELGQLSRAIGDALFERPQVSLAGVAVYDAERQTVQRYTVVQAASMEESPPAQRGLIQEEELPFTDTELGMFLDGTRTSFLADSRHSLPVVFNDRRRMEDVAGYVSAPIRLKERLLGAVYAGSSSLEPIAPELVASVVSLARVATPVVCNCLNHLRFAAGDRRRDSLIELSNALNGSLEVDTVLSHARRVLGSLEGHCVSDISLLNEGNKTFRCYRTVPSAGNRQATMPPPTVHQVTGSVLGWLLEHGSSYESEDLERSCRYEEGHEFRKHGVRRYIGVPLLARGRIMGGLLFGTPDPRPRRKIEYWLYENIALQLALAVDNAVKHEQLERFTLQLTNQNAYLQTELRTEQGFGAMIGSTPSIAALRADILRVSGTDATVLITGETGVGKELVARDIHEHSTRAAQPFIKVNCPSIPEGMIESELFGHERGAFTSAVERRIGRFELAHEGTIFLDEIGELSLSFQAKLLRVLQDGEFERVGGSKTMSTNARVIAATNRNLLKAIDEGRFRPDLYFRINVFPIVVPPLRERREDIPALVEAFLSEFSQRLGKRIESVDGDSLADLCQRSWPGNIRELRHAIERAAILSDGPRIHIEPYRNETTAVPKGAPETGRDRLSSLDAVQARHIRQTLADCGGVIEGARGAAAALGLKPSTLRFRMKRLGIGRFRPNGESRTEISER